MELVREGGRGEGGREGGRGEEGREGEGEREGGREGEREGGRERGRVKRVINIDSTLTTEKVSQLERTSCFQLVQCHRLQPVQVKVKGHVNGTANKRHTIILESSALSSTFHL